MSIKNAYILAFTLIAFWAFFAFYTLEHLITEQKNYANLINISGKQRMLSQKSALYALRYLHEPAHEILTQLRDIHTIMSNEHRYIIEHITDVSMIQHYNTVSEGLHAQTLHYLQLLENVINKPDATNLNAVLHFSNTLLPQLDTAVKLFEQESLIRAEQLKMQERFILIGTLFTLLLEYIFIVRPVSEHFNRHLQILQNEVKKRTRHLEIEHKNVASLLNNTEEQKSILSSLLENTPVPIYYKNEKGLYLGVNRLFTETFGMEAHELINKHAFDVLPETDARVFVKRDNELFANPDRQQVFDYFFPNPKTGKSIDTKFYRQVYRNANGEIAGVVGAAVDISRQREFEMSLINTNQELKRVSTTDTLTRIANRFYIENKIATAMQRLKDSGETFSILLLDIDNFKLINDTYGHNIGDDVLQHSAKLFKRNVRAKDSVSRWGGEEFLILCPNLSSADAYQIAEKILFAFASYAFAEVGMVTVSIGVAENPATNHNIAALIQLADDALYRAKRSGKNCVMVAETIS